MLFIYPIYQQAERQDDLSQIVAHKAATEFVDAVRTKGYITPTMYQQFFDSMAATGNVFDVQMEHLHKKYNPIHTDAANPGTFQGKYETYYDGFYTEDIMKILFPNTSDPVNSQKRRYLLEVGDFFTVKVKNKNRTLATSLQDILLAGNTGDNTKIYIPYGGMVLNEDYN